MSGFVIGSPSAQSPKAYDLANLTADQLAARLAVGANETRANNLLLGVRDSGYRYKIHPNEIADGLTDADLAYGYDVGHLLRYKADATGVVAADTALQHAINAAIDEVFIPGGTFKIAAGVTVTNKNNLWIHGVGTLDTSTAPSAAYCIQLVGTCDNITFSDFAIQGPTNAAYGQTGIGMAAGQTLSRIRYINLKVDGVNVGLSFNAHSAGSGTGTLLHGIMRGNIVSNIRGTAAGQGYGLHLSEAQFCTIEGNQIDNASRHSIYHAGGSDNLISSNVACNHRLTEHDGVSVRCSFVIARSSRVLFIGNKDTLGYDGSIEIAHDTSTTSNCSDILVVGNTIEYPQNDLYSVLIGEELEPTGYTTSNIKLIANRFVADYTNQKHSFIWIVNGDGVRLTDNDFHLLNVNGTYRFITAGNDTYATGSADFTNSEFSRNIFKAEGSDLTQTIGIDFCTNTCTNASIHHAQGNRWYSITTPFVFDTSPPTNTTLFLDIDGEVLLTLNGCTTAPTANCAFRCVDQIVTLELPTLTGVSNVNTASLSGLPSYLQPVDPGICIGLTIDNNILGISGLQVESQTGGNAGQITLWKGVNSAGFTSSGTKGSNDCTITYRRSAG